MYLVGKRDEKRKKGLRVDGIPYLRQQDRHVTGIRRVENARIPSEVVKAGHRHVICYLGAEWSCQICMSTYLWRGNLNIIVEDIQQKESMQHDAEGAAGWIRKDHAAQRRHCQRRHSAQFSKFLHGITTRQKLSHHILLFQLPPAAVKAAQ